MGNALSGFLQKFFSGNAIISRVVRATLVAFGSAIIAGQIPLPHYVGDAALVVAALIPAGQNQSAPSTATDKKAIPIHS